MSKSLAFMMFERASCISKVALLKTPTFAGMNNKVLFKDLGMMDYKDAWDYQEILFSEITQQKLLNRHNVNVQPTQNYLLFVEHPHVYTLGKSGDLTNLLLNETQLFEKGASFYRINRGGDITYHGPGQFVGYPILDLENFFTDIHKYLRLLEEAIILTLAEYSIYATRSAGETGVWIDIGTPFSRKICAMGVRASRWVTMHGFALNVNTNLGYFDHIVPCGIKGKGVTSMAAELGKMVNEQQVKSKFLTHFESLFNATLVKFG